MARYGMDGTFKGMQELSEELSPCAIDYAEVKEMLTFGVVSQVSCQIHLEDLSTQSNTFMPLSANDFFELFLEDANKNLVDVPVLITNFRDKDGNTPNEGGIDYQSSRLVHRFFMFDTISGIKQNDGFKDKKAPAYVRYASDVRLTVQMDPATQEQIRKPLLEISYREYGTDLVTQDTRTHASFKFEYYEDGASFEDAAEIVIYVFNVLVLLIVAIRLYFWVKLNPPRYFAKQFVVAFGWRALYYLTDVWSNVMFLVYFIITMYWFIMYKLQANAYILMP